MAMVQVMYWKDIPCAIRATEGRRNRVSRKLPDQYMDTVDAVAMREGATGSDEYQAAFRWGEPEERIGTPEEAADAVLAEILAKYTRSWLRERSRSVKSDQHVKADGSDLSHNT